MRSRVSQNRKDISGMDQRIGNFESLEAARAFFRGDRYATETGAVIDELREGQSVCSLEINEHHMNAEGKLMGGVIFTLIDFAFAAAAATVHRPTVVMQVSVSYLNAAKGKRLTARAECRKDGRTSCVYNVQVTDEDGRDIAQAVMTGFKLGKN